MKKSLFYCCLLAMTVTASCRNQEPPSEAYRGTKPMQYLMELTDAEHIGPREASSQGEIKAGQWIQNKLTEAGYEVTVQPFNYRTSAGTQYLTSVNYSVEKKGKQNQTVVLAAHYDSTGSGLGAADNGTGVVAAIIIAEKIQTLNLPFNVRILFPGAEENGLNGSLHYVKTALENGDLENVVGMINLDTIAGGDYLYIHSAEADYSAYQAYCESLNLERFHYNSDTILREAVLQAATDRAYKVSDTPPAGETGPWSDHTGFACAGMPTAYLEATNFEIKGADGYDGYSQTSHPQLWDCYDTAAKTACDPATESKWGKIWHTEFDTVEILEKTFPGRISNQLDGAIAVMMEFLTDETYLDRE